MLLLFDLDGVVLDTESLYYEFWEAQGKQFLPDDPDFALRIKGQSLPQIFAENFGGDKRVEAAITRNLRIYEERMTYRYFAGVPALLATLHSCGVPTAIVTSSTRDKMARIYAAMPEFAGYFSRIFTAESVTRSKPAPDCYLHAAEAMGFAPKDCIVFEDSLNGCLSGRAAGMTVVGVATTLPAEHLAPYSDTLVSTLAAFDFSPYLA